MLDSVLQVLVNVQYLLYFTSTLLSFTCIWQKFAPGSFNALPIMTVTVLLSPRNFWICLLLSLICAMCYFTVCRVLSTRIFRFRIMVLT